MSWMIADLLTGDFNKTEFLVIELASKPS